MPKTFNRERRYLVAKFRDIHAALSTEERNQLSDLMQKIDAHRDAKGKRPLCGVFVESDWPIYQSTWEAIEAMQKQLDRSKRHE